MSDLLSAASLCLAVLGVLFGAWYPEIMKALETKVPLHTLDREAPYRAIRPIYYTRALPIVLSTLVFSIIMLPDACRITIDSFKAFRTDANTALQNYGAVETLFVFVVCLSLFLFVYSITLTVKLGKLLGRLRAKT